MTFAQADLFALPLLNGGEGLGQIVEVEASSVVVLITARAAENAPVRAEDVLALFRVPASQFSSGAWPILGLQTLPPRRATTPYPDDPIDPAFVEAFVNACHGHILWDDFGGEDTFTNMLRPGVAPPSSARFKWIRR